MKPILKYSVVSLSTLLLITFSTGLAFFSNNKIYTNYFPVDEIDMNNIEELVPLKKISLPRINGRELTCTGMTYDFDSNLFWICNYGKETPNDDFFYPSIVAFNSDFSCIEKIINLDLKSNASLQGITYDTKTKTLWFTTGDLLVNATKNGEIISRFKTSYQYNGLLYNITEDNFYVLCYKRYLLKVNRNNIVLEKTKVNYNDQDHISFDEEGNLLITVGSDYSGDNNYVVSIASGKVNKAFRIIDSNADEGIVAKDGMLFVCNDGLYHNAASKENWVSIYAF